jgi:HEAT repeat protein
VRIREAYARTFHSPLLVQLAGCHRIYTGIFLPDVSWGRRIFDYAAEWLRSGDSLKKARASDVLGQLRRAGNPVGQPEWLFREESLALITRVLKEDNDALAVSSAISALGHLGESDAIPIIVTYIEHPSEDVRFAAAGALGCFPNDPRSVPALLALTTDASSDVRDWSVFSLGVQGDVDSPEVRDALLSRLSDTDEDVREEAAVGLGRRKDQRLLTPLRVMLDAPELKERVAEAAAALLGLSEDPADWKASDYRNALHERFPQS